MEKEIISNNENLIDKVFEILKKFKDDPKKFENIFTELFEKDFEAQLNEINKLKSGLLKGLIISVTAIGTCEKDRLVYRTGAKKNDLVAVTGNLGAAYMGLQILEREKEVFKVNPKSQPDLEKYTYCIQRQLKPEARHDVIKFFKENKVTPTSMIDISDGLSSEILHISEKSKVGIHIYEDKIPIDNETIKICNEFKINEITAALNGGEDYEILFTVNQSDYEIVKKSEIISIIGHVTKIEDGNKLITGLEQAIDLTAQGWSTI